MTISLEDVYLAVKANKEMELVRRQMLKGLYSFKGACQIGDGLFAPIYKNFMTDEREEALNTLMEEILKEMDNYMKFDPDYTREQIIGLARTFVK